MAPLLAMSRTGIETVMNGLVGSVTCQVCQAALRKHVQDICDRWSHADVSSIVHNTLVLAHLSLRSALSERNILLSMNCQLVVTVQHWKPAAVVLSLWPLTFSIWSGTATAKSRYDKIGIIIHVAYHKKAYRYYYTSNYLFATFLSKGGTSRVPV